jgi:uncharacterized membrane protein
VTLAACGIIGVLLAGPATGGNYAYRTLDDPGAAHGTYAEGINDAGSVAGHYVGSNLANQGYIVQPPYGSGQYTTIQVNGTACTVDTVNNAGTVAGFFTDSKGTHGFTLTSGGTLTTIDDPNAVHGTIVAGINNLGDVVGYYYDSNFAAHGFSLIGTTFTTINYPGAGTATEAGTFAQGINDSRLIVGGAIGPTIGNVAFTFDGTTISKLTVPNSTSSFALGLNDAGNIVGWFKDSGGQHGFVDIGGAFTTLDDPNAGLSTQAYGINASGTIAGT